MESQKAHDLPNYYLIQEFNFYCIFFINWYVPWGGAGVVGGIGVGGVSGTLAIGVDQSDKDRNQIIDA